jgi:hypothetical protein
MDYSELIENRVDDCLKVCRQRGLTWLIDYRNVCSDEEREFVGKLTEVVSEVLGKRSSSERFYVSEKMREEIIYKI